MQNVYYIFKSKEQSAGNDTKKLTGYAANSLLYYRYIVALGWQNKGLEILRHLERLG